MTFSIIGTITRGVVCFLIFFNAQNSRWLLRQYADLLNSKCPIAKKIYRLKEDQAFSLSLELDRREKVARHPSADFLLHSIGGGGDFVYIVIGVQML